MKALKVVHCLVVEDVPLLLACCCTYYYKRKKKIHNHIAFVKNSIHIYIVVLLSSSSVVEG